MRSSAVLLALLLPALAFAQRRGGGGGGGNVVGGGAGRSGPQTFTLSKETHTAAEDVARARFTAGDCKGALDAFDVAIEHSIDPTLRRDRGICHEKLGDVFPAIDDYRAYIAAEPNASDADDIRARLAKLEGTEAPKEGGQTSAPPPSNKTITEIEHDRDRKDEASGSSLRLGKGFVVGGFVGLRAFGQKYFAFGQRAGGTVRWSFDAHSTVMLEIGWAWNDSDRASGSNGPSMYGGYEFRAQLDDYGTHSLIFGVLVGYERFMGNASNIAVNGIAPRGRFGYRLVIGPSFGIEATVDGGPVIGWAETGGSAQVLAAIGGGVGLVLGF